MIKALLVLAWLLQATTVPPDEPTSVLNRDLFGVSIDRAGDLDGDGIEDLWIADPSDAEGPGAEPFQCLWAVSGASGEVLRRIAPPDRAESFGSSVCAVGDVDGDGMSEVASTCCFVPTPEVPTWRYGIARTSPQGESAVFVFSGRSGERLLTARGPADDGKVSGYVYADGPAVRAVGDWNRDGAGDLAIGWAYADSDAVDCGRVDVVSGKDGTVLASWLGAGPHDRLGTTLCVLADQDGDGRPELAASALPDWQSDVGSDDPLLSKERAGYVQVLSSKGTVLQTLRPPDQARSFGLSMARFPDADGDDVEDLLLGRPFSNGDADLRLWSLKEGKLLRRFEDPFYVSWKSAGKQTSPPRHSGRIDPQDWQIARLQEHVGYRFGSRLMAIPDRDGDGRDDLLVTVADGGGPFDSAYVGVLSSKTGRPIALVPYLDQVRVDDAWECTTFLGLALCALPDMDGDAVDDFAIGGGSAVGLVCPAAVVLISGKQLVPFRWIVGVELRR